MSEQKPAGFINKEEEGFLRTLCCLFGPTGCESEVADFIETRVRPFCHSLTRDAMDNLVACIRTGDPSASDRQRVMLSAHMDEVGLMVTEFCEDGLLRFDTVGGIDPSVLEGRKVTVGDERGRVSGVVASKAIHHKKRSDRKKPTPREKLYLDVGADSREEAEKLVEVGSFATFDSEFYTFGKGGAFLKGKALDDRLGCAALISVMERLWRDLPRTNIDYYFCFTVREEIGLSGARVVAQRLRPQVALVLECTAVADLPDTAKAKRVANLGQGGALSVMDRATIYDRELIALAQDVAERKGIPVQLKRYVSGGNDAGSIHKSGEGVRCLALSVPTRYLHSPSCVARLDDYHAVCDLTEAWVRALPEALMKTTEEKESMRK